MIVQNANFKKVVLQHIFKPPNCFEKEISTDGSFCVCMYAAIYLLDVSWGKKQVYCDMETA